MRVAALALVCGVVYGQEATAPPPAPVVLEFTGKPLVMPFKCSDEDIQLAGLTCSEEDPCPVYLEVASVNSAGSGVVAAGNLHSAAVTLFSILLGSQDGGRTWREVYDRIRGAA